MNQQATDKQTPTNPLTAYHDGDFPPEKQSNPGVQQQMKYIPDCGEDSYRGHGRLQGRKALITGGDSGIGRAVAIAFAREGADVAISFLPEEQSDAEQVKSLIEAAGQRALLLPADLQDEHASRQIVKDTAEAFGGLDILVLNAGRQIVVERLEDLTADELRKTFDINVFSQIFSIQTALDYLPAGASIITTSSIQGFEPTTNLLQYAATKAALANLTKGLAAQFAERGIRVNAVAPGPIWTPLQVACGRDPEAVVDFGQESTLQRAGQPVELAGVYVFLASDEASYVTGQIYGITGGARLF